MLKIPNTHTSALLPMSQLTCVGLRGSNEPLVLHFYRWMSISFLSRCDILLNINLCRTILWRATCCTKFVQLKRHLWCINVRSDFGAILLNSINSLHFSATFAFIFLNNTWLMRLWIWKYNTQVGSLSLKLQCCFYNWENCSILGKKFIKHQHRVKGTNIF